MMSRVELSVKYTLQCLISIFIALEVSVPPNPYKTHLIVCLLLLIALKYNFPNRVVSLVEKLTLKCLNYYWK